ncbi:hypothetical protein [Polyangium sorediatum]|uniref:Uncharacterized protein n=1 Tax=Polyangium sorediatum TaxID=889274 RepID=A0ABT6NUL7_9BACT|nr:hypothetical protein [Polyangium sorediatum]MDI1431986.1 hypothetical protein [Polyangium sorediatum]
MSEFHGGFFVRSVDAGVAEPIRKALASALTARRVDLERNHLTFAARRGCPVMHVAVRGAVADGKDYAFFHEQNADLGADVARAAGVEVWAYHYENQVGTESVRAFGPDGTKLREVSCRWDDLAKELGGDLDRAERAKRLFEAAPLGALARTLGIPRSVLDMALGYDTPTVEVALVGPSCTDAIAAYLAQPLRSLYGGLSPATLTGELDVAQTFYFPAWMVAEIEGLAGRLDVPVGTIAWAAWEAAKLELHHTTPICEGGDASGPARFLPAPPAQPPQAIEVPQLVSVSAKALETPPTSDKKVKRTLAVPSRVLDEVRVFSTATDRSLSWSLETAYLAARERLHAATARS